MITDVIVLENVLAVPNANAFCPYQFLFQNNNQVEDINCYFYCTSPQKKMFKYSGRLPEPEETIDEGVFGGWIWFSFSHFIMDALPRIWYQKHITNEKTYFFDVYNNDEFDWYKLINQKQNRTIKDLGNVFCFNPYNFEMIRKPTLFKKLTIPNPALLPGMIPTDKWFDFLRCGCNWNPKEKQVYKKVYIPRILVRGENDLSGSLFGERGFVDYLRSEGFFILDTMITDISDQHFIVSNAETVLVAEGSAIFWSLFCSKKTEMIIISRRSSRIVGNRADITDEEFGNIARNFINTKMIDKVAGMINSFNDAWANKSVFINWKEVSIELKNLSLVKNIYKEKNQSREDVEYYQKIYPFSEDTKYQVEKHLRQIGYRGELCKIF